MSEDGNSCSQPWKQSPLGDIFRINGDQVAPLRQPKLEFVHYSIPAYDETGGPSIEYGEAIESNKTSIGNPAVLVSKLNPRKPRVVAVSNPMERTCCSTEFICYYPKRQEDVLDFWVAYFSSEQFSGRLARVAVGSTNSHTRASPKETLGWYVPDIPYAEQQKIAQILDTAIRETEAIIAKLKAVKLGLLHDLLTRGIDANGELRPPQPEAPHLYKRSRLGWIPKDWNATPLEHVADLQVGFAFKSDWFLDTGKTRLLRGDNVGYGSPDWDVQKFLDETAVKSFENYLLNAGDVVVGMDRTFTKTGAKFSIVNQSDLPCLLVQRVGRFVPLLCSMDFLRYLTNWPNFHRDLFAQQKGMDIPHLSKSEILSPIVPVPPEYEQSAICERMASIAERITNESNLLANRVLKFAYMPSASKPFFGFVGLLEARSHLKNRF
ncbi:restriction endonuclease subunit S [Methylomonas sp. HYX-M1]|uniref:restriction endonuclease subunit S n=1 Tax=Methylomonas sp. HYX-M1 TaxID=3139307 RepID=UPI00345C4446